MMENYDRTVELIDTAYNSAGRSSEQFAKYQDTVEYKLKQLSNTWEQLRTSFLSSDTYKGFIDFANKFVKTINNMDLKQILTVGTIGLTLGRSVVNQFIGGLKGSVNVISTAWTSSLENSINKIKTNTIVTKLSEKIKNSNVTAATNALINVGVDSNIAQNNAEQILQYTQIKQKLIEINNEIQKIDAKGDLINNDERERLALLRQQSQELREQKILRARELQNAGLSPRQINDASSNRELQRGIIRTNNMTNIGTTIKGATTNALSAGVTSALMMSLSGAEFSTVIKTALTSAIIAAIPSLISAVMPTLIGFLTGSAGVVLIGAAIVGGIVTSVKKANDAAKKAELDRLKAVQKTNEELRRQQEQNLINYKNKTNEKNTLNKDIQKYQELSKKAYLNTDEMSELSTIADRLNENYPDIIKTYDENSSQISFNTQAIENLNKTLQEEIEQERIKVNTNINQQIGNYINASNTTEKYLQNYQKSIESTMSDWGYSKVAINSQYDANEYKKYGVSGYIIEDNTKSGSIIAADAQVLLNSIEKEFALKAGFTENLYNAATEKTFTDFAETLEKANISLGQFSNMTLLAAKNQKEAYDEEIVKAERERIKNALQTMENVNLSDELSEIFSYAGEDNAKQIKEKSKQAIDNYFKNINDAFSDYGGFDENKDFLKAIGDWSFSRMARNDADITKIKSALESLGYGEKEDIEKNIKSIKELFSSGTNVAEFDELSNQMQEAVVAIGYSSENWNENRKTAKEMTKMLQELMTYNMLVQDNILPEGLDQDTLKQNMSAILNFEQTINSYTNKTLNEYSKEIEKAKDNINDENLRNSINEYYAKTEDSILSQWQNAIASLNSIGLSEADNLSYATAKYLDQMIKDFNLSESRRKQIVDVINSNTKGLSQAEKDILFSIDLTQSYGDLLSNSEDYINQLITAGMNATDAANLFNKYIKEATLILGKAIFGAEGAILIKEQLNKKISGFKENFNEIFKAQEEFMENGSLSAETYFSLLENGFEKYVDITKDGYVLLGKSAEEAWTKMAMQPRKELENNIEVNQKLLKQAKEIDISFKPITWSEDSIASGSVLKKTYNNFNDLIAHYQKFGTHVENVTEKQKEFIEVITEAGYVTREEYIKALNEGTLALKNMRSDVYIQGLINLTEAMDSTNEVVEDLKEEIEDLNEEIEDLNKELEDLQKQLIEDKEALADTEDELRQAIHGSDNFKSSLDGLVNYTNKLEDLDKSIEKIKESLEDVANIDEAKGLLTQLNEQYDNKIITIGAENIAIDTALSNLQSTLLQNYGNYISFDEKGNPLIDFAYMTMDANDEIRKAFEEEYNLYNEYKEKKENNLNTIEKIEKEKLERREESLNNFVKIQEDVISILKEQAKEEIDATKDKYDALEEADNDYIEALEEAIEKQRRLRDQQNQYEDLATKEKKLSLLQRDTSGANRKEVLSLESEIQDDRQNLLDNEVDNIIESMKELYEKQKEARDAEIEYMEEITENAQYFAEWASNIMSTWQSVEDMQAWYLENDPNAQDMTVEQTEVYLNEIGEKYSDYVQYIATLATDFTTEQEELNSAINQMYENTSNNVENIGTVTQETAQNAANEIIEQATKARDDARDKLQETQDKITETQNKIAEVNQKIAEAQQKLGEAEQAAINAHGAAMQEMINASQSAMKEVSAYATKTLADMLGVDLSNEAQALEFANKYGFINQNGYVTQNFKDAVESAGGDISKYQTYQVGQDSYKVFVDPGHGASQTIKTFSKKEDAEAFIKDNNANYSQVGGLHMVTNAMDIKSGSFHFIEWGDGTRTWYGTKKQAETALEEEKKKKNSNKVITGAKAYKRGGLVDYTGPAWVDGSKYKPEAFLNADDTKRIGEAAKILADIPIFNSTSNAQNAVSTNIGDTSIEIHINVEKIDSDYDVDQMVERFKQDIVDVSNPIGTPVILRK